MHPYRPIPTSWPSLVATPIAQVIHLAGVDQSLDAILEQWRNHLLEIDHVVTRGCEAQLHCTAAGAPIAADTKLRLDIRRVQVVSHVVEVVAEWPLLAFDPHIIW